MDLAQPGFLLSQSYPILVALFFCLKFLLPSDRVNCSSMLYFYSRLLKQPASPWDQVPTALLPALCGILQTNFPRAHSFISAFDPDVITPGHPLWLDSKQPFYILSTTVTWVKYLAPIPTQLKIFQQDLTSWRDHDLEHPSKGAEHPVIKAARRILHINYNTWRKWNNGLEWDCSNPGLQARSSP